MVSNLHEPGMPITHAYVRQVLVRMGSHGVVVRGNETATGVVEHVCVSFVAHSQLLGVCGYTSSTAISDARTRHYAARPRSQQLLIAALMYRVLYRF